MFDFDANTGVEDAGFLVIYTDFTATAAGGSRSNDSGHGPQGAIMKLTILTFLTVLLSLTAAGAAAAKPAETVSLRVGEQKTVTRDHLRIKFVEVVEDSRCPMNARCIWAGNAKLTVTVAIGHRPAETFEVNSTTGATALAVGGYSISFVSLTEKPAGMGRGMSVRPRLVLSVRRLTR
jgi:hypothetical protein